YAAWGWVLRDLHGRWPSCGVADKARIGRDLFRSEDDPPASKPATPLLSLRWTFRAKRACVVITDAEPDRLAPLTPPAPMGLRGASIVSHSLTSLPRASRRLTSIVKFSVRSARSKRAWASRAAAMAANTGSIMTAPLAEHPTEDRRTQQQDRNLVRTGRERKRLLWVLGLPGEFRDQIAEAVSHRRKCQNFVAQSCHGHLGSLAHARPSRLAAAQT